MERVFTIGNLFIIVVIGVVGLILAYATYLSACEWSVAFCTHRYGDSTVGQVVNLRKNTQGRGEKHYLVYRFYVNGIPYEKEQQISKSNYRKFSQTKRVTINYLPLKPSISRLGNQDYDNTYRNLITYVAFAAVIVVPPMVVVWIIIFYISNLVLFRYIFLSEKRKNGENID